MLKQIQKFLNWKILVAVLSVIISITCVALAFTEEAQTPFAESTYENAAKRATMAEELYKREQHRLCQAEVQLAKAKLQDLYNGHRDLAEGENEVRLVRKTHWTCAQYLPDYEPESLNVSKVESLLEKYDSPLNAQEYIDACAKYPVEMCAIYLGIMTHESRLCTAYAKPDIEPGYHNCSGLKSEEILRTHRADESGSWLRKFSSYREYYDVVLDKFHRGYWLYGITTPEQINPIYVGHYSQNWINTVRTVSSQVMD